jgi:hypothetical protein
MAKRKIKMKASSATQRRAGHLTDSIATLKRLGEGRFAIETVNG